MGYNPWGHKSVGHDLASERVHTDTHTHTHTHGHTQTHTQTHTHTHTQAQLGDGASVGLVALGALWG